MTNRRTRLVGAVLIILGLLAVDVLTSVSSGIQSDPHQVLAGSRKRSKRKGAVVRRKSSRRIVASGRGASRRSASVRRGRGRSRPSVSARRGRARRKVASYRRRASRTVALRAGHLIPTGRVLEIQRALMERGFLSEATGTYDNATVEAMKAFQRSENISATGYPTAHALQRLGLPPGPPTTASANSEDEISSDIDRPQMQ